MATNLRISDNSVDLIGRLNSIDLNERVSQRDNRKFLTGRVTFTVNQEVGGQIETEEIPVEVFAFEKKLNGDDNPAFVSVSDLMHNGVSAAATGDINTADQYRISGATVDRNNFTNRQGQKVSYQILRGSFFNKATHNESDTADFEQEIIISSISDEYVDDMPTGRLKINGFFVCYNNKIVKGEYIMEDRKAIDYVKSNWNQYDTVRIGGKIRMTAKTVEKASTEEVGFGQAKPKSVTKVIREFIITTGSPAGYDDGRAYDYEEIAECLAKQREAENQASAGRTASAPAARTRGF